MGSVGRTFKKFTKSLTPLDIISLATATPLSAAADPMRPLNKISEVTTPDTDLKMPKSPPAAPTILTDDTSAAKTEELKRKKVGRVLTQRSMAGSLSDASTYKPTLLGG